MYGFNHLVFPERDRVSKPFSAYDDESRISVCHTESEGVFLYWNSVDNDVQHKTDNRYRHHADLADILNRLQRKIQTHSHLEC